MNEVAFKDDAVRTIVQLLRQNEAVLVDGLTLYGVPRTLAQIETRRFVADHDYYYLRVEVPKFSTRPLNISYYETSYLFEVTVIDYARTQPSDAEEAYEGISRDFDTLIGRLVGLFYSISGWQVGLKGKYKRPDRPEDQKISVVDSSGLFEENKELYAGLVAKINFGLIGQCVV